MKQILKNIIKKIDLLFWAIFIFSCLPRFLFLDKIPLRVDGDALRFALDGLSAWREHWSLFSTGWQGHTNFLFYLIGFFVKIFKNQLLGLRLFSVVGGNLSVVATYLLAKKLFDKKVAFWAAVFLAVCPFHLVFSRVGTEAIWTSFFAPLVAYLILESFLFSIFLAGFLIGFSQYFYPGARILPIMALFQLIILVLYSKLKIIEGLKKVAIIILGIILVYFPMINHFYHHPDEYSARVNIVGIFQSGWLVKESAKRPIVNIFWEQIKNSFQVFWLPVNSGSRFWFIRTPYLDFLPIIFFSLGIIILLISLKKIYQPLFLLGFFVLTVFFAGVLTIDSPTPSRYVIIFPFLAIIVGIGLEKMLSKFKTKIAKIFFGIILVLSSGYSYWRHETIDTWKYDTNTQIATFAGRYLSQKTGNYQIYFLGNNNLYYNAIPTLPFLTKKEGTDIFKPIEKYTGINEGKSYFIILPDRKADLGYLRKNYPLGKSSEFKNPLGDLLFYLFEK